MVGHGLKGVFSFVVQSLRRQMNHVSADEPEEEESGGDGFK